MNECLVRAWVHRQRTRIVATENESETRFSCYSTKHVWIYFCVRRRRQINATSRMLKSEPAYYRVQFWAHTSQAEHSWRKIDMLHLEITMRDILRYAPLCRNADVYVFVWTTQIWWMTRIADYGADIYRSAKFTFSNLQLCNLRQFYRRTIGSNRVTHKFQNIEEGFTKASSTHRKRWQWWA